MTSWIETMQPKIGLSVILCMLFVTSAQSAPESCIQCDSTNEGETNCGYVGEEPIVASCESPIACFTQIYEKNANEDDYPGWYTKRGCLDDTITCSGETCVSCDTENNCNNAVFPAARNTCLKCTDSDCDSPRSEYCNVYLQGSQDCVTLFDEEGKALLKNCYSDIPQSTRDLCSDSNYLDCKKCSGKDCNTDIKRDGLKCHQCTGLDCLEIKTVSDLVDCRSSCYIGMNANGEPVRGCASDFENTNRCSTDGDSTESCFVCDEDYCNAVIYPKTGRLECHTCVDGDCEPSEDNLEYCPSYSAEEKCVTIFDATKDEVVARGCLSTLETQQKESCQQNSTNCQQCGYSSCNKDDSKLKTDFCISCSSEDDPECAKENSIMEKRCSSNQCFSRLIEREDKNFGRFMERGCLDDLLQATECLTPDCLSCSGKNCNNKRFPENRIMCKSCELGSCNGGAVDKICNQYIEDEACFTFFGQENEVIFKECYADVPEETRKICDDSTDLSCSKCNGDLCNTDIKRRGNRCYKCEGLECLTPSLPDVVDCLSECYVGVNAKGETLRGCSNEIANSSLCGVSDLTCLTCSDDHCNGIVYPSQDRLTCVKCSSQDCVDLKTKSEYCEVLNPDEKCVSVFDNSGVIIERGCSSAIQNSAMCTSTSSNCLQCNFDSCNVETSVNQKFHCISCSSEDDSKCVSDPQSTQIVGCSTNQCYSRLLDADGTGQHIERGCGEELTLCSSSSCETCTGERCNSNTFPSDRHSCYHCFGDHCAMGNLHEKLCTVYNQSNNECVTVYGTDDVVLYRECYVDAALGTRDVCDTESDLTCSKCSGDLCNNDVKRRGTKCSKCEGLDCFSSHLPDTVDCLTGGCYVGLNEKGETKRDCASAISNSNSCAKNDTVDGTCLVCEDDNCNAIIYPTKDRLICKECLGETCEDQVLEEKYCEKVGTEETCVSVFNDSDYILERGCSSTVQSSKACSASDPNCLKCSFSGCNTQSSKNEIHHCVACDSKLDPNCVTSSTTPSTKTCPTNLCYSRLLPAEAGSIWQHVEKGCFADLKNQSSCTGSSCSACQGDRCNNNLYPTDRISCLECRNDNCKSVSVPSSACELYNRQQQSCITVFNSDNEVFYRGCFSDAASGTQELCNDSSEILCTKCLTKDCNHDTVRRGKICFKCQGIECFQPSHPADVVNCLSNCYMGVNQGGESVRDCESAVTNTTACGTDDNGTNRCSVCADDLCNGVQFPLANRLQCHKCNDENCEANDDNLDYCDRYGAQERCVTVFSTDKKVTERGCSSSLHNQRYCEQNYGNCLQCPTNGCNTVTSQVSRLCATCNSTTDPNCVINPSSATSKYCEKGCYTRLVNQTLVRGCVEDLGETFECISENGCMFCNDVDKCNVADYPDNRKSCKTCTTLESCKNPTSKLCVNYKENDSCVTIFSGYNVARKGCLSDQSTSNQLICSASSSVSNTSSPLCTACSGSNNCNIDTVRKDENCIICNSALEPNCAQRPTILPVEHCSVASEGQCFTRIQGGATVRGCLGILTATDSAQCRNNTVASQCIISTGQGSNNKAVPLNRLKCFHCDSRTDESCADNQQNVSLALPCKKFSQPENCLKLTLSDDSVVRGCVADFSADICKQGSCQTCKEISDGCNFSHASLINISSSCLMLSLIMLLFSVFKSR